MWDLLNRPIPHALALTFAVILLSLLFCSSVPSCRRLLRQSLLQLKQIVLPHLLIDTPGQDSQARSSLPNAPLLSNQRLF
jgi:hypothetical protein